MTFTNLLTVAIHNREGNSRQGSILFIITSMLLTVQIVSESQLNELFRMTC